MAFPCPTSFNHHLRNHAPPPIYNCTTTTTSLITLISSSKINFMRSFPLKHNSWSGRCHATSPQSEPPPEKHLTPFSGVATTYARFLDTVQIFFAVLFWMSLFFWSSAWDRGSGGRPKKGSRFGK